MLRRYMCLITRNDGLDTAIPLINDPSILKAYKKKLDTVWVPQRLDELYHQYADVLFDEVFEKGNNLYVKEDGSIGGDVWNNNKINEINNLIKNIQKRKMQKIAEFGKANGSAHPIEYQMFQLRAQYVGDVVLKPIIAVDEKNFEQIKSKMSPWHAAFYILDGLINGKTTLGRFDNSKEKTILLKNMMKDDDINNDKKKIKVLRREFYNKINNSGEEDPDEI